jgi:hypothetical protein
VAESSVNGFDAAVADGWIREFMEYRLRVVLGKDLAGTVAAVGDGGSCNSSRPVAVSRPHCCSGPTSTPPPWR